ncbi:LysR family transcriptional regulator [Acidiphilium acidophilum]|uniref:LysR family transcriptional regulator n=1 Tax=Acidiphilium acidophilum TaxID=76588 RepID=A0AAW9DP01_ACIAO|nr:LysR family transcriptional regulator [Acidiphilium acidophilum]MDX5930153.1 LysR family transcriptional regulator [Acidiphilium acidophilum]
MNTEPKSRIKTPRRRNFTLRQLKLFEAVARTGSFTRTAEELHLTQPAVSNQIKQLEDQIGTSLIPSLRSRHGIAEYAAAAQHFREPPHQGQ